MEELINDSTYICKDCEETIRVFSASGQTTQFCPFCSSRDLEGIDD